MIRNTLYGVYKVSHKLFCFTNSDLFAFRSDKSCLKARLDFKRHFLSNTDHSSESMLVTH